MSPTGKPRVKKPPPPPTPKRPKPSDMPPLPTKGDANDNDTFAAVGRALSQWEYFEAYIGLIYGHLVGDDASTSPAMRAYGAVSSFSTRYDMIKVAAEAYFLQFYHQPISSSLDKLMDDAKQFSTRRNEIAHGIVQPFVSKDKIEGFALGPSRHTTRKHKLYLELDMSTTIVNYVSEQLYAYTSIEIEHFRKNFERLGKAAEEIYMHLYLIRVASPPPETS